MSPSLKGSLLISPPHLSDPNFARSVVLIAEHGPEGAFGLVINRRASLRVAKLWEAVSGEATKVEDVTATAFLGGPVEASHIFLLHRSPDFAEGQDPVVPGVWLGNDKELFSRLVERERSGELEHPYRAYCGYAGWDADQLEAELGAGGWLVQPASVPLIFDNDTESLWKRRLEKEGGIYRLFADAPQDPELN